MRPAPAFSAAQFLHRIGSAVACTETDHGALLANKVIVYKYLEHWKIGAGPAVVEQVADPAELSVVSE